MTLSLSLDHCCNISDLWTIIVALQVIAETNFSNCFQATLASGYTHVVRDVLD